MAIGHLSDNDIQNYLDGNLTDNQLQYVSEHIDFCPKCKNTLIIYQNLYSNLKTELPVRLSPNFSSILVKQIWKDSPKIFQLKTGYLFFFLLVILGGLFSNIEFGEVTHLVESVTQRSIESFYFDIDSFSSLSSFPHINNINLNLNLIILTGVVLIFLYGIDYLFQTKRVHQHSIILMF